MKAMKTLLMAVMTVFVGATFTSCLDSGNATRYPEIFDWVTITDWMGFPSVKTDNGLTLNVMNPSTMSFELKDGTKKTPGRAMAFFYLAEGETIVEGKTEYDVLFANDYYGGGMNYGYFYFSLDVSNIDYEPLETETSVKVDVFHFGNGYIDTYYNTIGYQDTWSPNNIKLCITGVDNETLKVKMMHTEEIASNDSKAKIAVGGLTFNPPSRTRLEQEFPELKTFGSSNDSIYLQIENKTIESTELEKIKIRLNP